MILDDNMTLLIKGIMVDIIYKFLKVLFIIYYFSYMVFDL